MDGVLMVFWCIFGGRHRILFFLKPKVRYSLQNDVAPKV